MSVTEVLQILNDIKVSLLEQKSAILNKSHEFLAEQSDNTQVSDEAEAASKDLDSNLSILRHERDRKALFAIEKALSKINEGSYGRCECCGDDIQARRLQARPFTTLCLACMEDQESNRSIIQ